MKTSFVRSSLLALSAVSALLSAPRAARACGGCFSIPTETTVVTDHRMAFSISTQQTVLWDQIKYGGSPTDFSWVLPVRAGAVVELSHDEWFAALDAMTEPVITGPPSNCNPGGGIGCGSSSLSASAPAGSGGGNAVQVVNQSVIGPYDTVTLRSTDAGALESWLAANGYALPNSIRPTLAAYVAGGFDFIALRLRPGKGVQSMQPVRVVTPGADATLPLRMVAAGVGAQVGITLYVIGEGRYQAKNPFFNAVIDDSQLLWIVKEGRSNYQEISQLLMKENRGRTWLTEFSQATPLVQTSVDNALFCGPATYGPYGTPSLAGIYLGQCRCGPPQPCPAVAPSGTSPVRPDDASAMPTTAEGSPDATDTTDATDATDEPAATQDAFAETGSLDGSPVSPDATCSANPCAGFDDMDVALVGLHSADTWVTRLRAILPAEALAEGDLQLQAAAPQARVSNRHSASRYDQPYYSPCPKSGGCNTTAADPRLLERGLVVGSLGFAGAALARRRRRAR